MGDADRQRAIEIRGIRAGYALSGKLLPLGRKAIVDGVSVTIQPGEILGLLGPNASGKSTLLRAVVDSSSRWAGQVLCDGEPLLAGQAGYMPQAAAGTLSPWLEADEEIALPLRARGISRQTRRAAVERLLAEWDIRVPLDRRVEQLSGGQRVKVALLRSLAVADMRLYVLDEPFEGLDAGSRANAIRDIRAVDARGIPVILTSHREEDLRSLGARAVRLAGLPVTDLMEVPSASGGPQPESEGDVGCDVDALSGAALERDEGEGRSQWAATLVGLVGFVAGLLIWAALTGLVRNTGLLPGPLRVGEEMIRLVLTPELRPNFAATMVRALTAWGLANLLAIPLGILLGYNANLFRAAAPWLSLGRCLPIFALVGPAVGVFPGYPELQRGALIWLTLFLVSLQAVSAAAALAPRRRVEIARVFGASHWFRLRRIMLHESVAGIFAGLEVTLPLAVIVTFVVETFLIPNVGLGLYVFNHLTDQDLSLLFAHFFWPAMIATLGMWIIRRLSAGQRHEL